jgi:cell division protein FtsX
LTGPWLLRRLAGDARRHGGVWLGLGLAFALAAFCAAGARTTARAARAADVGAGSEPPAHVVAYLDENLSPDAVADLRGVLARMPGVEDARVVSPRAALERLRGELGARAAVLEGIGPDLMFSSIEIAARPAIASALAFRLRRVAGVADVDLVSPPASVARAVPLTFAGRELGRGLALVVAFVVVAFVVVVLGGALARLRVRYRPELRVLGTLGLSRAAAARPAQAHAAGAGAVGAAVGLVAAVVLARVFMTAATPPARELAVGAFAFVLVAYVLAWGALRVRDVAAAR